MGARPRIHTAVDDLLYDECDSAIKQARLNQTDAEIATMYLLENIAQMDIAVTLGIARSTVSRRLPVIVKRIEQTASRMGLI